MITAYKNSGLIYPKTVFRDSTEKRSGGENNAR